MTIDTTKLKPELPEVAAVRAQRSIKRPPQNHPFSFLEALKIYTGWESDLIWGPFFKRFRAARKENVKSTGFSLADIWDGIPAASQTRPGKISKFVNFLLGRDPAPTLKTPPRSKPAKESHSSTNYDDWRNVTQFNEDWSPSQIDFTSWYGRLKHPADYDDAFYTKNYQALYDRMCDFAETWFGQGVYLEDWRDHEPAISTWQVPMTDQFLQYARVVAHEDKGYVNWKDILNDPRHRKWLCVSILSQVIERKIFNQLLFGATAFYREELDRHDSTWVSDEGFTRKDGRRQIARAALHGGLIPGNFWDDVDDLAGQTVLIFQPLFMLLGIATHRTASSYGAAFWQEIHTMLAMAGYFQVCTAISPSIFHILSATPGVRFQWEEEEHADQGLYEYSRDFHKSHEDRWRILAELNYKKDSAAVTRLTDNIADTYMPLPTTESEYWVLDHNRRRGGKVMYAVFPKLTRYTAENVGHIVTDLYPIKSEDEIPKSEGMRISLLSRCMVVYYQGLVHDKTDFADGGPLDNHLHDISWGRMTANILPYLRHYWDSNGIPRVSPHWPIFSDDIDVFLPYYMLFVFTMQVIQYVFGTPDYTDERNRWLMYFFKPALWIVVDLSVYFFVRALEVPFFSGYGLYTYLKIHVCYLLFNIVLDFLVQHQDQDIRLFSLICVPLAWADEFIFKSVPNGAMTYITAMRGTDLPGVLGTIVGAMGGRNGPATGS
ncbi:hypothetical protein F4808DRAFT_475115 [Astrocystis sublimbata]|nr:hypothetical protein F4808DRAFT_475115 [Astrocystis sublimbata]